MTFVALAPTATNVPEYEAERPLGACGLAGLPSDFHAGHTQTEHTEKG
jgi:hypothetical protein